MKILLVAFLAMFSITAFAGIIPASYTDEDGDVIAEDGSEGWTLSDFNTVLDDSGFEMTFQAGLNNTGFHKFGIYQFDAGTDTKLNSLTMFDNDLVGADSNLVWNLLDLTATSQYGSMDLVTGVGAEFGFWFESDGFTSYSHSALNAGSVDYFGFYWNDDQFDNWNLAVSGSDNDFNNSLDYMQVEISDVSRVRSTTQSFAEVPEPASAALLGLGLAGLAGMRRRKVSNLTENV